MPATLAKTMGCKLPRPERSIEFIQSHQQTDGSFKIFLCEMDPKADLAVLYNTVQGVVALRALGSRPRLDPAGALDRFFVDGVFKKLPWYTTSFFPLFFAALGKPFPKPYDQALCYYQSVAEAADGYLGDHVAATFHLAHYFRLEAKNPHLRPAKWWLGCSAIRNSDGGWNIREPDWDAHARFDAVFILYQLGSNSIPVRQAMAKAAAWSLSCQNRDGGFGHYPGLAFYTRVCRGTFNMAPSSRQGARGGVAATWPTRTR